MSFRNQDIPNQRDFGTDSSDRYVDEFKNTVKEGRSYEDLQVPDKLRLREIIRRLDDYDRYLPIWEAFVRTVVTAAFTNDEGINDDLTVPHTLGSIPKDIIAGLASTHATFIKGDKPWTDGVIYLRASTPCTVKFYLVG